LDEETATERYYLEQVDTHFRPEFVNRIDRVIPFHALDRAQIEQVAAVTLMRVRERDGISERGIALEVADDTLARLASDGYSNTYGARALRRAFEDDLVAPLARTLAKLGDRSDSGTVRVSESGHVREAGRGAGTSGSSGKVREQLLANEVQDRLTIEVTAPLGRATRRTLDALTRVSTLRRSTAAALELPPVRELRDRLRVLVAELGFGAHARKDTRSAGEHSAEIGRLQAEHGRIVGTLARLDELRESIESAEELTIAALYEGEPASIYQDAAEDAYRELQTRIVDALLLENERHSITVHLQEQDPRGALITYLLPLLECLDGRGWSAYFHVYGDKPKGELEWPQKRAWGPPRSPDWLTRRLLGEFDPNADADSAKRRFRDVLMCLQGRHAGAIMDSQLGLLRFDAPWQHERLRDAERRPAHLLVRFVSRRAAIEKGEWDNDHFKIEKPLSRKQLDATPKRAHFDEHGMLSGTLTSERCPIEPARFWTQIERVMFSTLVTHAFASEAEEP
jgi:ATP-dependent Clp protease ATP-binding subunit ClpC